MTNQKDSLPTSWHWSKLGDVCEINMGQSPPGDTYRNTPDGIPFFQGKTDFGIRNPITRVWCVAPKKIAIPGDILLSVRAPVGPTNIADVECCIGRGLASIHAKEGVDREFIRISLKYFEYKLRDLGSGSTFQAINRNELIAFQIPLPPYIEQKRIAAILNEQMAAVERARSSAEDQYGISERLSSTYLQSIFDNLRTQNWPNIRLGDACEEITGTRNPCLIPDMPFYYVDITSVDNHTKKITVPKILLGKDAPSRARQVIKRRDVIVSTTRPNLNAVALVQPELDNQICSTGFCVLRAKENLDANYLFMFVQCPDFVNNLSDLVKGALYPAVTDKLVRSQFIPLPPIPEQQRIAVILNEQLALVKLISSSVEIQLKTINELPNVLLQRAFTGGL